ncbi:MAG: serine/threonine protein kinase [Myxococcaceae bacterium]|nr:MAG: serine/threonine protein kinase [Myxococcaceae bacterium]
MVSSISDACALWSAGTQVGSYRVLRRLAVGGMAEVYEAEHAVLGSRVALKRLLPEIAARPDVVRRFLREARAAATLHHPNIARVYDADTCGEAPYLVMELIEGSDLRAFLEREGPIAPSVVVELLAPVLSAVAFAHARGVIHRDLKPGNVMLGSWPDGSARPVVVDFGLAHGTSFFADSLVTADAGLLGTPAYLAPELCESGASPTQHTDQYALGVIAYECLTGRRPHEGANLLALVRSIVDAEVPAVHTLVEAVPRPLSDGVMRALSRSPADRFPSVSDFARALANHLPPAPLAAPERDSSPAPIVLPTSPHRRGVAVFALAALAAIAALAWRPSAAPPLRRALVRPVPLAPPLVVAVAPAAEVTAPDAGPSVAPRAVRLPVIARPVARPSPARAVVDAGAPLARCIGPNGVNLCL